MYIHDPATLASVLIPEPLEMEQLETITATAGKIEASAEDWRRLIAWQHELDRYLRDLRQMMVDIHNAIEGHNQQFSPPE